jgi:Uri superfamily endonuclease
MTKITKRLFSAIKERNEELINEYSAELQAKWRDINASGNSDMDDEESAIFSRQTNEALEFVMGVLSQKRQTSEMANGMRPDLFYDFVRELAAGCYK